MDQRILWLRNGTGAFSKNIIINGLGMYDAMKPSMVDRKSGTDDYLLMYFHTPVHVHHDGELRPFPAHTFFLWSPGNRHTFGNVQKSWTHSWMHCSGESIPRVLAHSRIPLNTPLLLRDSHAVDRHLESIHSELTTYGVPDPEIVESLTRIWIRCIDREIHHDTEPVRMPKRLLAAVRHIEDHLAEPITLADLAHRSLLSISRFSAEFRTHLQASPIEYVLHLRLQHALHLLRDRNLSVAQVSVSVGFADPFYFSRQFRRRYGLSPMQYRRKLAARI
ncbi:MAG: AraC family transcriptional regulator [Planctomycetes bacterium]|nr:AraC family transcriptional regulator [Planctomycetota bacterium]